ncbi:MAG TPA: LCP family protein [Chloroflexota bacterium]|nr:LCP family protein [Chloroflexota bacterium]
MTGNRKVRRPSAPTPGQRPDRVIRSAVLALLVYALGIIPFYFLTPVHQVVGGLFAQPMPPIGSPTPFSSVGEETKKAGADAPSIVATPAPVPQTPVPLPTTSANDARFAFLLMGYGGGSHPGGYLTDSMMVVIVDPSRKTLTLLSLPRDAWVPLAFNTGDVVYNKLNTAYAFAKDPTLYSDRLAQYTGDQGAGTFATDTVSRLLGIPVKNYLTLDFQGFRDMIDAVGGIDVNVPDSFAAKYPINDDPNINAGWTTVRFTAGLQHMDGERAIEYARAREAIENMAEGSDFARSRRQRLIMEAFKNRLLQPGGLIHLPQLLAIAARHVDTNYSLPAASSLAQLVTDWKSVTIYQTALTDSNYLEDATGPDGTYTVVPNTPDHSWAQIRAFARALWKDPAVGTAMASIHIEVVNDSGAPGLADQVSADLIKLGYLVAEPTTGTEQDTSDVVNNAGKAGDLLAKQLARDLQLDLPVSTSTASSSDGSAANVIILELGKNAQTISINVPADTAAPSSQAGIEKFGIWPWYPTPTPMPTRIPQSVASEPADLSTISPSPTPNRSRAVPPARPGPTEPVATPIPAANPNMVVVPKLVGLPEADAQQIISQSGLMTTYVNYQTAADVPDHKYFLSIPPGAVLSQIPQAGTAVPRGTKVMLAVRK